MAALVNSQGADEQVVRHPTSFIERVTRMRSRQNSSQPEPVERRNSSDPPHLDLTPMIRFQPFDSPNGSSTPPRKTSSVKKHRQSFGIGPVPIIGPMDTASEHPSLPSPSRGARSTNFHGSNPGTPTKSDDNSPWIGGTGLGSTGLGKSGRVIERLMAENDRLRREMKAEIAKREELQGAMQTQRPKLESLQAENSRLANIKAMDDSVLVRRDRKIEELKNELEIERKKRKMFEGHAQQAERQLDEHKEASNKEVQAANEQARHATTHADILQTSHKQLSNEYRQRTATIHKTLRELSEDKEEDRRKLAKLDIVANQMRQESERMRKAYDELVLVWEQFDDEKTSQLECLEDDVRYLKEKAAEKERSNQDLWEDMHEAMGKMRWVMGLERLQKTGSIDSPPPSPLP